MLGFLQDLYLRPSCHVCLFSRLPRVADISLGDFWGVGDYHPEWDDDQGTSLVLVQTEKGQRALEACRDSLVLHDADLAMAIRSNQCICGSVLPAKVRTAFFNDLERLAFEKVMKKYMLRPSAWRRLLILPKRMVNYGLKRLQSPQS
jgi:coenzyme F420-reducing hydrogenase beta subunit